ncbi:TPA: hypothetical protein ACX6QP_002119 [Photobacterium damselae]
MTNNKKLNYCNLIRLNKKLAVLWVEHNNFKLTFARTGNLIFMDVGQSDGDDIFSPCFSWDCVMPIATALGDVKLFTLGEEKSAKISFINNQGCKVSVSAHGSDLKVALVECCIKVLEIKFDGGVELADRELNEIDALIFQLFSEYWDDSIQKIEQMRAQLHKNLTDQVNGWWSGHTAYHLMVNGGFLLDGKSGTKKTLTLLGKMFIESMGGLAHDRINELARTTK